MKSAQLNRLPTLHATMAAKPNAFAGRIRLVCMTFFAIGILSTSCTQIPQESVTLSSLIGQDIAALQVSYDQLIQRHFDSLRAQREMYLEAEWIPSFVGNWIRNGRLIEIASGTTVWSSKESNFAEPTLGIAGAELLLSVQVWAEEAVRQIQVKRAELMAPLNADEAALRADVASAFATIINANATVTAYLSSARRVRDAQDQVLEMLKLREMRDKFNTRLIAISNKAESGLQVIRRADDLADRAEEAINREAPEPEEKD